MKNVAALPASRSDSYFTMEVGLMGGFSIAACVLFWALVDKSASLYTVSQVAFLAAFVANHPHFLSSYVLLYGDHRHHLFTRKRYFWAAVVVPVILGGALIYALATANQMVMSHIITSMFFFVGWHYVKQIFGCVIVTSAQRKMYYSLWERRLMLVNLFAVWFMSWLSNQVKYGDGGDPSNAFAFYGINHYKLNLDPFLLKATYALLSVTLLGVLFMHVSRYIKTGAKPSAPGVAAYAALYAWYLPAMIHPSFAYFIPLFHSLQYMAFVWALKRNHVAHEIRELQGEEWRRQWINKFFGFFLLATVLGALSFEFVPKALDAQGLVTGLGPTPFLAAFLLFINIHHYFIDNVIWRSDNAMVKQFLFQAPPAAQSSEDVRKPA